jgi:hypothetical protein
MADPARASATEAAVILHDRLLDLDRRYRLVLNSTDYISGDAVEFEELLPEMKAKWKEIKQEIRELYDEHPRLFAGLERRFREERPESPVTVDELVDFAYAHHLQLDGEPYTGPFRAAN